MHCVLSSPKLNSDGVPNYAVVNQNKKTKMSERSPAATSVSHSTSAMNCVTVYMCIPIVTYYIYTCIYMYVCGVPSAVYGKGLGLQHPKHS